MTTSSSGREEPERERLDRNLDELLGELRVALPGVQVLFAFLLAVPFNTRFSTISTGQERLYLVTLLLAGLASALLIAPTAAHRITFRQQQKPFVVASANRFAIGGLACLAAAMTSAVALVCDVVFSTTTAIVCAAAIGLVFAVVWFAIPAHRRWSVED